MAAAQGPENTLVVVNADSQDSLAVANLYVDLRDIPACNVLYLSGISKPDNSVGEGNSSGWFKKQVLKPLLVALKDRGLEKQIDCVAYSAGFPTRINFLPEMKTYLKQTDQKYQINLHAPFASITSLTYLHRNAYSDRPNFLELDANHYANPRRMGLLDNPFSGDESTKFITAIQDAKAGNFDQAIEKFTELASVHPNQMAVVFSLAQCHALNESDDKAIEALQRAKQLGFASKSLLISDQAFSKLRSKPAFQMLIRDMEDLQDRISPTRSFSGRYYWAKNGWPNGTPEQGERYLLSSVLAVTGKNQSTLEASLKRLKASVIVDGSTPQGNVYFADHSNARSRTRKNQFQAAAAELKSLGHQATIGPDIYPIKDSQVIGATIGSGKLDWKKSGSKFLPGAIADNFTSYGAWWAKPEQTQISEFLDLGAAGAWGTVYEPFTIPAKIPNARWHAHYARGCTLSESFFQSVSGPFQALLIGDPLCCPFGKFPDFQITGITNGETVTDDFILKIEQQPDSPPIEHFELFFDGVLLSEIRDSKRIRIAIENCDDGYHKIRIAGVRDSPVANRHSETVEFLVQREGDSISFDIANPECNLGGTLKASVVSTAGEKIQILQNYRTIATLGNNQVFEIEASKLGLGKTKLQAVTVLPGGQTIRSKPVPVTLVSP